MRHPTVPLHRCLPVRPLTVYRSRDFRVIDGVNEGDPLSDASDLQHEDVYALGDRAKPVRLDIVARTGARTGSLPMRVGRDSPAGTPGAPVCLDCHLSFMGRAGAALDALVFVEVGADGLIAEVYLHPLAPVARNQGYILVAIDRDGAAAWLADAAGRPPRHGTRLPLAAAARRPVAALRPGHPVRPRAGGQSGGDQGLSRF